ncbi:MAG: CPBP family intramembrane metalloprotease [Erysipelotrichaceae bacterium]|nr:CPBP family intramembrane metalloprotease [Erysipelotrichaceae bacterium]
MSKKERRISKKYARRSFNTIGLLLIIYALAVLILPFFFHYYLVNTQSEILRDEFLYYGLYLIMVVFGTIIPFFLMRKVFKLPLKKMTRNFNPTFVDLFVQTIVFFTICIGLTYVSNILFSYLGMQAKLISSIGFSYDEAALNSFLYVFMLIIVTPLIEEYAFRGVLLNVLAKYGKNFGLYASAVIFALAHRSFVEMIPAFAMGVLLGKTALRYKNIVPTIFIHILFKSLIYALVVIPASIIQYMAYGLVAVVVIAAYLMLSGRYERIKIQKLRSNRITNVVFFSCPAIIIAMMLMIAETLIFLFAQ